MAGFYNSSPWAPEPTLLTGPNTFNGMGDFMPAATASAAPAASSFNLGGISAGLSVVGALTGAIGSFFSAQSAKSAAQFQSEMSAINARMAERSAQSVLSQGQQQIGALTLKAGQLKSSQRANMAANGLDLGEGSAAEVQASTDIMKSIDSNTINANAVRAANAARTQSVNYANQSLLQGASAASMSPFSAGASSLLTSASGVASSWYSTRRLDALENLLRGGS